MSERDWGPHLQQMDEIEARKNAGHQDMKAAPAVGPGRVWEVPEWKPSREISRIAGARVELTPTGWFFCSLHEQAYAPGFGCSGCDGIAFFSAPSEPAAKTVPVFMSTNSAVRKLMPVATGCLNYFPDALLCVAFISRVGNDKHNPGQPLHWAKEKSTDEPDAEVRHMLDYFRGEAPDPGLEPLGELGHLASKAWRALAHLQRACDAAREEATKGIVK